jgi:hypothetical protein
LRSLLLFASRTLFLSFHLVKRLKILQPNNAERLSAVQGTPSANSWHFGTFRMDPSDGPLDSLDLNDRTFRATARPLCFFFLSLSLAGLFTSLMRWFSRSLLLPSLLLVVPWRGPSLLSTERPSPVDCCK